MLTVHHLGVSQSERIVWLCEELDLKYELKRYERRADNRLAPEAYKALHPMGIAPVITDGAVMLAESGAICDYINVRYGQGLLAPAPSDPDFAERRSGGPSPLRGCGGAPPGCLLTAGRSIWSNSFKDPFRRALCA
jgi:glutathione S-transferase